MTSVHFETILVWLQLLVLVLVLVTRISLIQMQLVQ